MSRVSKGAQRRAEKRAAYLATRPQYPEPQPEPAATEGEPVADSVMRTRYGRQAAITAIAAMAAISVPPRYR